MGSPCSSAAGTPKAAMTSRNAWKMRKPESIALAKSSSVSPSAEGWPSTVILRIAICTPVAVSGIDGRPAGHCVCRVWAAARPPAVRPGCPNTRSSPAPPRRKTRRILPGRAFSRRPAAKSLLPGLHPANPRTRPTHTPRTPNPRLPASEPASVADGIHTTRPRRRGWSSIIWRVLGARCAATGFEGATTGTGCVSIQSKGRRRSSSAICCRRSGVKQRSARSSAAGSH